MQIILTPQESEEYFYNALCNGLHYIGGYGLSLTYRKEQYDQAKSKLGSNPCFEDVLMQILRDGNTIKFVDDESDGEYNKEITLKDIHDKVPNVEVRHLMNMITENDDAETADVIIQTVLYDEVIFG